MNKTGRTEQAEQDRQKNGRNTRCRTGLPEHVCQERNAATGLPGQDSFDRRDMQNRTGKVGQAKQDR
jgi:hypothetical protein